jgi:hypothetical protein
LKREGRKFEAERKIDPAASGDMNASKLLRAFVRGARLTRIWWDIMDQSRISCCCERKVFEISMQLDAMGRRGDLAQFLDAPDLELRAKAAGCLVAKMPDRCLPVLNEIAGQSKSRCARSSASMALMAYENGDAV